MKSKLKTRRTFGLIGPPWFGLRKTVIGGSDRIKYCKETIEALQATGHHSAADWAIWMLWWRMMDWTTAKQVDEMRVQEIASLRQRIDQLEREKRGIGPEDQYA